MKRRSTNLILLMVFFLSVLFALTSQASTDFDWELTADFPEAVENLHWIRNATVERSSALGGPSFADFSYLGRRVEHIQRLQEYVEENLSFSYVNHEDTIDGSYYTPILTDEDEVRFNRLSFREVAGINTNGFRRVPYGWNGLGDPPFEYGYSDSSDLCGSWLYDDLKNGLNALRWSIKYRATYVDVLWRFQFSSSGNCEAEYAQALQEWENREYVPASDSHFYLIKVEYNGHWSGRRSMASQAIFQHSAHRPCEIDFYIWPTGWSIDYSIFNDVDGFGFEEEKLKYFYHSPESTTTERVLGSICDTFDCSNFDTSPLEISNLNCSNLPTARHACIARLVGVLKWNFEYKL